MVLKGNRYSQYNIQLLFSTSSVITSIPQSKKNMWRTQGINLLKRAVNSGSRPGFTHPNQFYGGPITLAHHYCSSNNENGVNTMSYAEAKRLMRLVNVEALKEKLGMENKEVIHYDELLKACQSMGVAKSAHEADAFARVLDDAGVILLFRDKVYLHPDKVVDMVRKAVPLALLPEDDPRKDEFKKLQAKKNEIDMLAHKQVRRILWTGLGFATVQVGLFFRLTFWEFSWDVMEPIAFFATTTGIVIGYAYFMITSRDPSYQDLLKRLFLSRQRKLIQKQNFDIQRFVELQKVFRLPLDSCASIKRRTGVELEPEDLFNGQ